MLGLFGLHLLPRQSRVRVLRVELVFLLVLMILLLLSRVLQVKEVHLSFLFLLLSVWLFPQARVAVMSMPLLIQSLPSRSPGFCHRLQVLPPLGIGPGMLLLGALRALPR